MSNSAREQFKANYEQNSIILFGGIAPGGGPTNSMLFGALVTGMKYALIPIAGGSLLTFQVAMYPFANQAVAANAIIQQPLKISMLLISPANSNSVNYTAKSAAITNLATKLQQHGNLGGLYSVYTPAYTYTNCILTDMYDASDARSEQAQFQWRLDFIQPLITLQAAQNAQNSLIQKLSNGTSFTGAPTWSGPDNGSPNALQTANLA